jgi:hypothetical protein
MRKKKCPRRVMEGGWREVVFAVECDEDTDECPCGVDYCGECVCPGPTEDGYEYCEVEGIMYWRRIEEMDTERYRAT